MGTVRMRNVPMRKSDPSARAEMVWKELVGAFGL